MDENDRRYNPTSTPPLEREIRSNPSVPPRRNPPPPPPPPPSDD